MSRDGNETKNTEPTNPQFSQELTTDSSASTHSSTNLFLSSTTFIESTTFPITSNDTFSIPPKEGTTNSVAKSPQISDIISTSGVQQDSSPLSDSKPQSPEAKPTETTLPQTPIASPKNPFTFPVLSESILLEKSLYFLQEDDLVLASPSTFTSPVSAPSIAALTSDSNRNKVLAVSNKTATSSELDTDPILPNTFFNVSKDVPSSVISMPLADAGHGLGDLETEKITKYLVNDSFISKSDTTAQQNDTNAPIENHSLNISELEKNGISTNLLNSTEPMAEPNLPEGNASQSSPSLEKVARKTETQSTTGNLIPVLQEPLLENQPNSPTNQNDVGSYFIYNSLPDQPKIVPELEITGNNADINDFHDAEEGIEKLLADERINPNIPSLSFNSGEQLLTSHNGNRMLYISDLSKIFKWKAKASDATGWWPSPLILSSDYTFPETVYRRNDQKHLAMSHVKQDGFNGDPSISSPDESPIVALAVLFQKSHAVLFKDTSPLDAAQFSKEIQLGCPVNIEFDVPSPNDVVIDIASSPIRPTSQKEGRIPFSKQTPFVDLGFLTPSIAHFVTRLISLIINNPVFLTPPHEINPLDHTNLVTEDLLQEALWKYIDEYKKTSKTHAWRALVAAVRTLRKTVLKADLNMNSIVATNIKRGLAKDGWAESFNGTPLCLLNPKSMCGISHLSWPKRLDAISNMIHWALQCSTEIRLLTTNTRLDWGWNPSPTIYLNPIAHDISRDLLSSQAKKKERNDMAEMFLKHHSPEYWANTLLSLPCALPKMDSGESETSDPIKLDQRGIPMNLPLDSERTKKLYHNKGCEFCDCQRESPLPLGRNPVTGSIYWFVQSFDFKKVIELDTDLSKKDSDPEYKYPKMGYYPFRLFEESNPNIQENSVTADETPYGNRFWKLVASDTRELETFCKYLLLMADDPNNTLPLSLNGFEGSDMLRRREISLAFSKMAKVIELILPRLKEGETFGIHESARLEDEEKRARHIQLKHLEQSSDENGKRDSDSDSDDPPISGRLRGRYAYKYEYEHNYSDEFGSDTDSSIDKNMFHVRRSDRLFKKQISLPTEVNHGSRSYAFEKKLRTMQQEAVAKELYANHHSVEDVVPIENYDDDLIFQLDSNVENDDVVLVDTISSSDEITIQDTNTEAAGGSVSSKVSDSSQSSIVPSNVNSTEIKLSTFANPISSSRTRSKHSSKPSRSVDGPVIFVGNCEKEDDDEDDAVDIKALLPSGLEGRNKTSDTETSSQTAENQTSQRSLFQKESPSKPLVILVPDSEPHVEEDTKSTKPISTRLRDHISAYDPNDVIVVGEVEYVNKEIGIAPVTANIKQSSPILKQPKTYERKYIKSQKKTAGPKRKLSSKPKTPIKSAKVVQTLQGTPTMTPSMYIQQNYKVVKTLESPEPPSLLFPAFSNNIPSPPQVSSPTTYNDGFVDSLPRQARSKKLNKKNSKPSNSRRKASKRQKVHLKVEPQEKSVISEDVVYDLQSPEKPDRPDPLGSTRRLRARGHNLNNNDAGDADGSDDIYESTNKNPSQPRDSSGRQSFVTPGAQSYVTSGSPSSQHYTTQPDSPQPEVVVVNDSLVVAPRSQSFLTSPLFVGLIRDEESSFEAENDSNPGRKSDLGVSLIHSGQSRNVYEVNRSAAFRGDKDSNVYLQGDILTNIHLNQRKEDISKANTNVYDTSSNPFADSLNYLIYSSTEKSPTPSRRRRVPPSNYSDTIDVTDEGEQAPGHDILIPGTQLQTYNNGKLTNLKNLVCPRESADSSKIDSDDYIQQSSIALSQSEESEGLPSPLYNNSNTRRSLRNDTKNSARAGASPETHEEDVVVVEEDEGDSVINSFSLSTNSQKQKVSKAKPKSKSRAKLNPKPKTKAKKRAKSSKNVGSLQSPPHVLVPVSEPELDIVSLSSSISRPNTPPFSSINTLLSPRKNPPKPIENPSNRSRKRKSISKPVAPAAPAARTNNKRRRVHEDEDEDEDDVIFVEDKDDSDSDSDNINTLGDVILVDG